MRFDSAFTERCFTPCDSTQLSEARLRACIAKRGDITRDAGANEQLLRNAGQRGLRIVTSTSRNAWGANSSCVELVPPWGLTTNYRLRCRQSSVRSSSRAVVLSKTLNEQVVATVSVTVVEL